MQETRQIKQEKSNATQRDKNSGIKGRKATQCRWGLFHPILHRAATMVAKEGLGLGISGRGRRVGGGVVSGELAEVHQFTLRQRQESKSQRDRW